MNRETKREKDKGTASAFLSKTVGIKRQLSGFGSLPRIDLALPIRGLEADPLCREECGAFRGESVVTILWKMP